MGSAPGNTTIKNGGKQYSGQNIQTITSQVFTFITILTNYSKPTQGNQISFLEDVAKPQRKTHQEQHLKSGNTTMGHMHMRSQGIQSTK